MVIAGVLGSAIDDFAEDITDDDHTFNMYQPSESQLDIIKECTLLADAYASGANAATGTLYKAQAFESDEAKIIASNLKANIFAIQTKYKSSCIQSLLHLSQPKPTKSTAQGLSKPKNYSM
jgi:hypothetical protein